METTNIQNKCIELAKQAILAKLGYDTIQARFMDPALKEARASFITIKKNGELRGCIGSLFARQELREDIVENAQSAAFDDPRFPAISYEEIENNTFELEVTILSKLYKRSFDDEKTLFAYLQDKKPGLVITLDRRKATFLPSVREELPKVEDFMLQLLHKAGISKIEFEQYFKNFVFETYT